MINGVCSNWAVKIEMFFLDIVNKQELTGLSGIRIEMFFWIL